MAHFILKLSREHRDFLARKAYEKYDGQYAVKAPNGNGTIPLRFIVYERTEAVRETTLRDLLDRHHESETSIKEWKYVWLNSKQDRDASNVFDTVDGVAPRSRKQLDAVAPFACFEGESAIVVDVSKEKDGKAPVLLFTEAGTFKKLASSIADFLSTLQKNPPDDEE